MCGVGLRHAAMKRESFNLFVFAVVGVGTLAGILLTSGAKKAAQKANQEPSFEERMAAFERKP